MNRMTCCSKCSAPVSQGARFCPACGTPIAGGPPPLHIKQTKATGKRKIAGIVVIAGLAVLLLMAVNFNLFLRLMAIGGTVLFLLSIAMMFLTFRKAKKISPAPLVISMILSLVTLWIYSLFLGIHFSGTVKFMGLIAGILIGIGWALTTPVRSNKGVIEREGNAWYLVVWGLVFALNQLVMLATGRPPPIAMVLLLLGTGIVLGNSGSLIAMFYRARSKNVESVKYGTS